MLDTAKGRGLDLCHRRARHICRVADVALRKPKPARAGHQHRGRPLQHVRDGLRGGGGPAHGWWPSRRLAVPRRRILRMGDRGRVVGVLRGRRAGATVSIDCRLHLPAAATERLRGSRIRPGAPPLRHPPAAGRRDRVGVAIPGGVVDRPAQTLRSQRSLGPTVRDVRGLPRRQSGPDHRALRAPVEGTQGPPAVAGAADGGDGRGRVDDQRLHLSAHVRALRRRRGHAGLGICHVPDRRRRSGLPAGRFDRRGATTAAVPGRPVAALRAIAVRRRLLRHRPVAGLQGRPRSGRRPRPHPRRGASPAHPARREPPTARHGRRHRPSRSAHRPGQPNVVHRPTDPCDAAASAQGCAGRGDASQPRRLQTRQRQRGPRRRRHPAVRSRRPRPGQRPHRRHRGKARGRRVRRVDRGRAGGRSRRRRTRHAGLRRLVRGRRAGDVHPAQRGPGNGPVRRFRRHHRRRPVHPRRPGDVFGQAGPVQRCPHVHRRHAPRRHR